MGGMRCERIKMKRPQLVFATVVLAAVALFGACNLSGPGGSDDKSIVTGVQAKLFQDPDLKTRDIHVDSQKGVVTLTGTVATDLEKSAVERIANQEKGVKQVVDQLALSGASAAIPPPAASEAPQQEAAPPARHRERRAHHRSRAVQNSPDAGTETASNAEAQQSPPAASAATQSQTAPVVQEAPPAPAPPPPPLQ